MSDTDQEPEEQTPQFTDQEKQIINAYMVFSNGDGLTVFEDLVAAFDGVDADQINQELQEIPHPYRQYAMTGCRLVIKKIRDINKLAEEIR